MSTSTEKRPVWKRKIELRLPKPTPKVPGKKKDAKPAGKQKRLVGLKIGSSQIAAAVVANNGSPHLVSAAREDLRAGIVAGGELREPEALAASLDAFFQHHDLPRTNVRLGIGSNRIGIRVFERHVQFENLFQ